MAAVVAATVAVGVLPSSPASAAGLEASGPVSHQLRNADGSWRGLSSVPAPGGAVAQGTRSAVAALKDGAALVVDVGPDGVLYHQIRRADGTWSGFQVVPAPGNGAAKGSEVAATGLPDGSVVLADVGPDGVVYYQVRRADGSWSGFKPVPAPGNAAAQGSKVAVAGLPDGSALLADVGPDGVVYQQIRRPNDTWTGFVAVPGSNGNPAHGSDVAAAGLPDGSTQLVIVDRPRGLAVSIEDLRAIFGSSYDTAVVRDGLPSLNAEMQRGGITTPPRVAAFLATLRHESGFRYNATEAGNSSPYRGRGFIQLTGMANYQAAGNNLGHDFVNSPDDAATLAWSAPIARYYWTVPRPLNADADALDMGLVSRDIGYAWSAAEDNARCADFKAVLQYYTGGVPAGINCIRPGH
jgi:predicted chitinase